MTAQPNRSSTPIWRKSSASAGGGECVEVAHWKSSVLVRDSGDRSGTILEFTPAQWHGFVQRVSRDQSRVMISVTSAQWLEFLRRIKNGELDPV